MILYSFTQMKLNWSEWRTLDLKAGEETGTVNRSPNRLSAEVSAISLENTASLGQNLQKVWIIKILQSKPHKMHSLSSKASFSCQSPKPYLQLSYTARDFLLLVHFVFCLPRAIWRVCENTWLSTEKDCETLSHWTCYRAGWGRASESRNMYFSATKNVL